MTLKRILTKIFTWYNINSVLVLIRLDLSNFASDIDTIFTNRASDSRGIFKYNNCGRVILKRPTTNASYKLHSQNIFLTNMFHEITQLNYILLRISLWMACYKTYLKYRHLK